MFWKKSIEEIAEKLHTNIKTGLTSTQISESRERHGENILPKAKRQSPVKIFFSSFLEPLVLVLLGVVIICLVIGELKEAIIISVIVIINAIIGTVQEIKSQNALDALEELSTPRTSVKRDGKVIEIDSADLVVGDIVLLEAGKFIPADIRLIEASVLQIDESALTGESVPVDKDTAVLLDEDLPMADRLNMAYMSTFITNGRAEGVVVAVGKDTEIGKIAVMMTEAEKTVTPLQERLAQLSKYISIGAFILALLMLGLNVLKGAELGPAFVTSITMAVAIIPESLPVIVSIILAISVVQMAKHNAIVKKMPAVETLGAVNIICTDKTGTLTLNQMTVKKIFTGLHPVHDLVAKDNPTQAERELYHAMILCNDSLIDENETHIGDPTELALTLVGKKYGPEDEIAFRQRHPRIDEVPFDSDRKLMTTVHETANKKVAYTKGALDQLLARSTKMLTEDGIVELTEEDKEKIMLQSETMSNVALRVLGFAYKLDQDGVITDLEADMTFIGAVGMIDPEREEAKVAIAKAKEAGVITIMITGDHKSTAYAIARNLEMVDSADQVISGSELDEMTDDVFAEKVSQYRVFSRVSPEHKVRIVQALQAKGNIVSMTGDGVNDAPSLQAAHIGVAMGITGTDVAKSAADMILMDDNFATIVSAIEEGRNIYNKIKRSIAFIISTNLGEVSAIFIAVLIGFREPLTAVQVLWVNLIVESLIAIPLGMDKNDPSVMTEKPRANNESIFKNMFGTIGVLSVAVIISVLGAFFYANMNGLSHEIAGTMAFLVMATSPMIYALSIRQPKKSMFFDLFGNKMLLAAITLGVVMNSALIWIPGLNSFFSLTALSGTPLLVAIGFTLLPTIIFEVYKLVAVKK